MYYLLRQSNTIRIQCVSLALRRPFQKTTIKVFARLFQKAVGGGQRPPRVPQDAKFQSVSEIRKVGKTVRWTVLPWGFSPAGSVGASAEGRSADRAGRRERGSPVATFAATPHRGTPGEVSPRKTSHRDVFLPLLRFAAALSVSPLARGESELRSDTSPPFEKGGRKLRFGFFGKS